jgi:hypothetical protein
MYMYACAQRKRPSLEKLSLYMRTNMRVCAHRECNSLNIYRGEKCAVEIKQKYEIRVLCRTHFCRKSSVLEVIKRKGVLCYVTRTPLK